jgi:hypothetical protein
MDASAPPKTLMGLVPSLTDMGKRLVDAGELYALLNSFFGISPNVVAAGASAATSTPMTAGVNVIASTAIVGSGVMLPPATLPGMMVTVINNGADGVLLYPNGSDQIITSDVAAPSLTAVTLSNAPTQFICIAPGVWKQSLSA